MESSTPVQSSMSHSLLQESLMMRNQHLTWRVTDTLRIMHDTKILDPTTL